MESCINIHYVSAVPQRTTRDGMGGGKSRNQAWRGEYTKSNQYRQRASGRGPLC